MVTLSLVWLLIEEQEEWPLVAMVTYHTHTHTNWSTQCKVSYALPSTDVPYSMGSVEDNELQGGVGCMFVQESVCVCVCIQLHSLSLQTQLWIGMNHTCPLHSGVCLPQVHTQPLKLTPEALDSHGRDNETVSTRDLYFPSADTQKKIWKLELYEERERDYMKQTPLAIAFLLKLDSWFVVCNARPRTFN